MRPVCQASEFAAIAGVVSCLLVGSVVVPLVLVLVRAFQSTQPDTSTIGPLLFPALILFALVFLAVLDIYALSPPRPGDRAGAVGRGVLGPGLVAVGIVVAFQMQGALASASRQQAQAEEAGALEARSDGLSISVTVVDARPGEPTEDGRIVLQLTVDLVVRSVSEIKLRQTNDGLDNQVIRFVAPASPDVAFFGGPGLPREIPAGFDQTYRLDVLVVDNVPGTPPSRAGPWTATLELIGPNDAAGLRSGTKPAHLSRFPMLHKEDDQRAVTSACIVGDDLRITLGRSPDGAAVSRSPRSPTTG